MRRRRYYNRRYDKQQRQLERLSQMRAAKARKHAATLAAGWTPEPKMTHCTSLSWAVRDDISGVTVWLPLKSARDTFRRITVLLRHYTPGMPR